MPRVTLTSKIIDRLPPPVGAKCVDYFDQRLPGLVLRASRGGRKSWNVIYRHQGRAHRLTLGRCDVISLDDARNRAREALCQLSRGNDPARHDIEITFEGLARSFVDGHVRKLRRARQIERLIQRELVAPWRNRKALTRRDIAILLADVSERAPVLANRVHAVLRRMYSWSLAQGLVETNPCDGVERPTRERARERVLRDDELRALWAAFRDLDPVWRALFRLCLLTGQRVGEVLTMRWADIHGDWWTIGKAKNGRSHRVPLSPATLDILSEVPRRGEYVFASQKRPDEHLIPSPFDHDR